MRSRITTLLLVLLCFGPLAPLSVAAEVATGAMLGPRYKPDRFYLRSRRGGDWELTYSDRQYRGKARGKIMMLRLAQGLFHDEWMTEHPFDPDQNTDRLIQALDIYKAHGVLGFSVSLQGGNAGYDKKINGIARRNGAKFGKKNGLLVSAFRPDGSLKPAWLSRLERLLNAADDRGMIVCLIYFYQGQDEVLESPKAIIAAGRNITNWLIEKDFRNVIIDVANEWDLKGDTWDHAAFIPQNIDLLVEDIRERFQGSDFTLPIGASTGGSMLYPASLAQLCDVVLLHGNNRSVQEKTGRLRPLKATLRPLWMTEDDNGRATTRANFQREIASAGLLFRQGAGWGYMPWVQAQQFPFEYVPGPSSEFSDDLPIPTRNATYFKAVLEHIAALVLKKPPITGHKKKKK